MTDAPPPPPPPRRRWPAVAALLAVVLCGAFALGYEPYPHAFDADYVGSKVCGECHTQIHAQWQNSPHALMTRPATAESVVGDFDDHEWSLPEQYRKLPEEQRVVARMSTRDGRYFMELWHPPAARFVLFEIERVVGYQYRQVYLTREKDGVLRRLPLQWSVERREFFPYWNLQERTDPSLLDMWVQMQSPNSAWNLFCARCHTTHLEILDKDDAHTRADTRWTDDGIACEACHGPGSHHVRYFERSYVNRVAAFVQSHLRGEPAAFIANPHKLPKGQDLSVCARCHGPDIQMLTTDVYRIYEPGYSKSGRINDLSPYFEQVPLQPSRTDVTVECWDDGRPKGIGMLFRSFVESRCYDEAEVRCYDCHDPHQNKAPRVPGILQAGPVSDAYCLKCHGELTGRIAEHTHHVPGTPGSFCYDCHMPREILNLAGGYERYVRTHWMSSIPDPAASVRHGAKGAPNACNECHGDRDAGWAVDKLAELWGRR